MGEHVKVVKVNLEVTKDSAHSWKRVLYEAQKNADALVDETIPCETESNDKNTGLADNKQSQRKTANRISSARSRKRKEFYISQLEQALYDCVCEISKLKKTVAGKPAGQLSTVLVQPKEQPIQVLLSAPVFPATGVPIPETIGSYASEPPVSVRRIIMQGQPSPEVYTSFATVGFQQQQQWETKRIGHQGQRRQQFEYRKLCPI